MKTWLSLAVILIYSILDCCAAELGEIADEIQKVAPITGISGNVKDRNSIKINFKPHATDLEKAQAQEVLSNYDFNEKGSIELNKDADDKLAEAANDESISDEKFMLLQAKLLRAKLASSKEKKREKIEEAQTVRLNEEVEDAKSP